MKKAEAATIFDLTTLLKRVPAVTGVVTSTDVYRKALEDYRFVINQAVRFMEHWTAYSMWKGDPDVDEADLELDKEREARMRQEKIRAAGLPECLATRLEHGM